MIVGCYTVHLYCDHPDAAQYKCTEWPGEFTGQTERECLAEARKAGWKIGTPDNRYERVVRCKKHPW